VKGFYGQRQWICQDSRAGPRRAPARVGRQRPGRSDFTGRSSTIGGSGSTRPAVRACVVVPVRGPSGPRAYGPAVWGNNQNTQHTLKQIEARDPRSRAFLFVG